MSDTRCIRHIISLSSPFPIGGARGVSEWISTPELRVEQFRSGRRMAKGWRTIKSW